MGRRKIEMGLIEDRAKRAATYAVRAKGIEKKARELFEKCGSRVAVVSASGVAGAVPLVWKSEEGVLDVYRAFPPKIRAKYTLRNHLEAELRKERAKLARVQQQGPSALAGVDPALGLGGMTVPEARELIEAINVYLSDTRKKLEALRSPADGLLQHIAVDADVEPQLAHDGLPCIGSNADMDAGFQLQMVPCTGKNDNDGQRLEEVLWGNSFQGHNAETMQPAFGTGENYWSDVGSYGQMQAPGYGQMQAPGYGNARYGGCPNLAMCHDESCNGVLPVGNYYGSSLGMGVGGHFIQGTPAPEQSAIVSGTSGKYTNAAPQGYDMGMGDNSTGVESYDAYWWLPQDSQRGDGGTSTSQAAPSPQCPAPGTRSSSKVYRHP